MQPRRLQPGHIYWRKPTQALILMAVGAVTSIAWPGFARIQRLPPENIMNAQIRENRWWKDLELAEESLPSEPETLLVVASARHGEILSPHSARALQAILHGINNLPDVKGALTEGLTSTLLIRERNGVKEVQSDILSLAASTSGQQERSRLKAEIKRSLAYGRAISRDWKVAVTVFYVRTGADEASVVSKARSVIRDHPSADLVVRVTGSLALNADISAGVRRNARILAPISILGICAFFGLFLRSMKSALASLVVIVSSIICTMSLMNLIGLRLTPVTASIPVFIVGLGSYPLHLLSRYTHSGGTAAARSALALRATWPPLVLAALTSAAGFGSLAAFRLPTVRDFGLFISFGVLCLLALTVLVCPAFMIVFESARKDTGGHTVVHGILSYMAAALTRVGHATPRLVVLTFAVALPVLLAWVLYALRIGSAPIDFLPRQGEVRAAADLLRDHFGAFGAVPFVIRLAPGERLDQPTTLRKLENLVRRLESDQRVARVDGLSATLRTLRTSFGRSPVIPMDSGAIRAELGLLRRTARFYYYRTVSHPHMGATRILVWTSAVEDTQAVKQLMLDVQTLTARVMPGSVALATGRMPKWVAIDSYLVPGKIRNIAFALVLVMALCSAYGTIRGGFWIGLRIGTACVVPAVLATLLTFAVFPLFGVRLDLANLVVTSLCLGVVPDFAIHLTFNPDCGDTVIADAIASIVAFAVFPLFGELVPVRTFGCLVLWTMVIAPVVSLPWTTALRACSGWTPPPAAAKPDLAPGASETLTPAQNARQA